MKATGIVRKLDQLGHIVLPMELRRTFDISESDPFEISVEEDAIVLHKYKPGCCLCGGTDGLIKIGDKAICKACAEKIAAVLVAEPQGSREANTGEGLPCEMMERWFLRFWSLLYSLSFLPGSPQMPWS